MYTLDTPSPDCQYRNSVVKTRLELGGAQVLVIWGRGDEESHGELYVYNIPGSVDWLTVMRPVSMLEPIDSVSPTSQVVQAKRVRSLSGDTGGMHGALTHDKRAKEGMCLMLCQSAGWARVSDLSVGCTTSIWRLLIWGRPERCQDSVRLQIFDVVTNTDKQEAYRKAKGPQYCKAQNRFHSIYQNDTVFRTKWANRVERDRGESYAGHTDCYCALHDDYIDVILPRGDSPKVPLIKPNAISPG